VSSYHRMRVDESLGERIGDQRSKRHPTAPAEFVEVPVVVDCGSPSSRSWNFGERPS
jgi:hypothetical protein